MKIIPFDAKFANQKIRGHEPDRPWDTIKEIIKHGGSDKTLLDIGCGPCTKTIQLTKFFKSMNGIDPSTELLEIAGANIKDSEITNLTVQEGSDNNLCFPNDSFDVVISILSAWESAEVYKVLKPGGIFILEASGARDKADFKYLFGKDDSGWRGQRLDYCSDDALFELRVNDLQQYFIVEENRVGFWKTYYDRESLYALLDATPLIRGYQIERDFEIVEKAISLYDSELGICLIQNRHFFICRKAIK